MPGPRFIVALAVLLASGCGGKVRKDGEPDTTSTEPVGGTDEEKGTDEAGDTFALPECTKGFSPIEEPRRICNYVVSGRCYDTKEDACGCACPRMNGTTCMSEFPQDDGHVEVTCW